MALEKVAFVLAQPGVYLSRLVTNKKEMQPVVLVWISMFISLQKLFFGIESVAGFTIGILFGFIQVGLHYVLLVALGFSGSEMVSKLIIGVLVVMVIFVLWFALFNPLLIFSVVSNMMLLSAFWISKPERFIDRL